MGKIPLAPANMSFLFTGRKFLEATCIPEPATLFHVGRFVALTISDSLPPTAPGTPIGAPVSTSQINWTWTPSVDVGSGLEGYRVYLDGAPNPVATVTTTAYSSTGHIAGTLHTLRIEAFDFVGNSVFGNTGSATTQAATSSSWFPNYPIMPMAYIIGDITNNYLNVTVRAWCGEKALCITAWSYPTGGRATTRRAPLQDLRLNYPGMKHYLYVQNDAVMKTITNPLNDARQLVKDLVDSPTLGNPKWYLRRASNGAQIESLFAPATLWELNRASLVAGLNSLGQRFDEAWASAMMSAFNTGSYAGFMDDFYDGFYVDNFEARYQQTYVNNGANSVPNTDIDYNGDSIADVVNRYDNTSTAGGSMCANGSLQFKASLEAASGKLMIPNAARWPFDYFDGLNIKPPLPLSSHPFYGKWEVILRESVNLDFGVVRNTGSATGLSYGTNGVVDPFGTAIPRMTVHQRFLKPDAQSRAGKSVILCESYTPSRTSNAFTQADYAWSRFQLGICMLFENYAHAVSSNKNVPMPLDELLLDIGAPLAPRSMGTLNETTLGFTIRPPDFTSGVAKFYWVRFAKGLALVRLDAPSVGDYPSADAAVSCTLPAPGTGKKWQMPNFATYVSPAIYLGQAGALVTRAGRNQTPTLNNGTDVTAVPLKPYHAAFPLLVDA